MVSKNPVRLYQQFQDGRAMGAFPRVTTDETLRGFLPRREGLRVLLIAAPIRSWSHPNILPLGQSYIGAVAAMDGHDLRVLDLNAERGGPVEENERFWRWIDRRVEWALDYHAPDVIGLGGIITQYGTIRRIARLVRMMRPQATIVLGGGIASCLPRFMAERLPVDVVVQEEGEVTFSEVLHRLEEGASLAGCKGTVVKLPDGQIVDNGLRPSVKAGAEGLDHLPWPLRALWPEDEVYKRNPVGHLNWQSKWKDGSPRRDTLYSSSLIASRGCPYSSKACDYCVPGSTLVLTDLGALTIADIVDGGHATLVWTSKGMRRITARLRRDYRGELIFLKAKSRLPVALTPNHELLTSRGWIPADHIRKGDLLRLPLPEEIDDRQCIDVKRVLPEISGEFTLEGGLIHWLRGESWTKAYLPMNILLMRLVGLYLAEGSSRRERGNGARITWAYGHHETHLLEETVRLIQDVLGVMPRIHKHKTAVEVELNSAIYGRLFQNLFGHGAGTKRIPMEWLCLQDDLIEALVRGYLDGDGCLYHDPRRPGNGQWRAETISSTLALQMQLLVARLGIHSGVFRGSHSGRKAHFIEGRRVSCRTSYQWYFSGKLARRGQSLHWAKVMAVDRVPHEGPVYNLEVEGYPAYSVNGIEVHNCYAAYLGTQYRLRSPAEVVDEMTWLVQRYGVRYIHFLDDLLATDYRWTLAFADEILRRKLDVLWGGTCRTNIVADDVLRARREGRQNFLERGYEAGMRQAGYGIESGSPTILKAIDKSGQTVQKMELAITETKRILGYADCSFMIGSPGETEHTVRETVDFCKRVGLQPEVFFFTTAYPGTTFWQLALDKGLIRKAVDGLRGPATGDIIEEYFLRLGEQGEHVRTNFSDLPDDEVEALARWAVTELNPMGSRIREPHSGDARGVVGATRADV